MVIKLLFVQFWEHGTVLFHIIRRISERALHERSQIARSFRGEKAFHEPLAEDENIKTCARQRPG